jgi:hypothetical protein
MSMFEINAATSASANGKDAGVPGNASGSRDDERSELKKLNVEPDNGKSQSSADLESLNVEPARPPVPHGTLRGRGPLQPAVQPGQVFNLEPEAASRNDPQTRADLREDRENEAARGSLRPRP